MTLASSRSSDARSGHMPSHTTSSTEQHLFSAAAVQCTEMQQMFLRREVFLCQHCQVVSSVRRTTPLAPALQPRRPRFSREKCDQCGKWKCYKTAASANVQSLPWGCNGIRHPRNDTAILTPCIAQTMYFADNARTRFKDRRGTQSGGTEVHNQDRVGDDHRPSQRLRQAEPCVADHCNYSK
jgi:hypothetical protein